MNKNDSIFELHFPTKVCFGTGAISALTLPKGRVLVMRSTSVADMHLQELYETIAKAGAEHHVIAKGSGEPYSIDINGIFSRCPKNISAVVGIGGGSTLDFAKALALLYVSGGAIEDYEFCPAKITGALPLFLIPTTCGTGSEVTPYCVINNSVTHRKFTLNHPSLRPLQAAIDPELLAGLPVHIQLATALDAFTHCLEALLNRSGNRLINPISEAGLNIAWKRIDCILSAETSEEMFNDLTTLSLYGGISIAHNRTGLIHTLSVAFAEFCDVPHGLLNAHLVAHALRHNLSGYDGRLAMVVSSMSGKDISTDAEAFDIITDWLRTSARIGAFPLTADMEKNQDHIIQRILQDKGLPGVSHGTIDEASLNATIAKILT